MVLWLRFKPSTNTLLSSRVPSCSLNLIGIACPNYVLLTRNWFSPSGVLLIRRLGDADAILLTIGTSVRARIEARGPYSKRKYVLSSDKTYCSSQGVIGAYKLADKSSLPLAGISWRHPSVEPHVFLLTSETLPLWIVGWIVHENGFKNISVCKPTR